MAGINFIAATVALEARVERASIAIRPVLISREAGSRDGVGKVGDMDDDDDTGDDTGDEDVLNDIKFS